MYQIKRNIFRIKSIVYLGVICILGVIVTGCDVTNNDVIDFNFDEKAFMSKRRLFSGTE